MSRLTHGWKTHLRLTNATVLLCGSGTDPVTQGTSRSKTQHCATENGEVHESNALGVEVVGRIREVLTLRQVNRQE